MENNNQLGNEIPIQQEFSAISDVHKENFLDEPFRPQHEIEDREGAYLYQGHYGRMGGPQRHDSEN